MTFEEFWETMETTGLLSPALDEIHPDSFSEDLREALMSRGPGEAAEIINKALEYNIRSSFETFEALVRMRLAESGIQSMRDTRIIYSHLAEALAQSYTDLFYVNLETDEFIEFHTDESTGVLRVVRNGNDFFESCKREVKVFVHADDRKKFIEAMDAEFLSRTLDQSRRFEMTYRRIKNGRTFYVQMEVSRMVNDRRIIVIAVSDIDELMKKRQAEERIKEEGVIYARLHALSGNILYIFVVDPETETYRQVNTTSGYVKGFEVAREGDHFFETAWQMAPQTVYEEDRDYFISSFTREKVMADIERYGSFSLTYRFTSQRTIYVELKAAMVEEEEGNRLIVGLYDIDAQVRREKEYGKRLANAETRASKDALTGVKNKQAFLETEAMIDSGIADSCQAPFAVVVFDVNGLKFVNDTAGHQAGDQYLRDSCNIICSIFKHSPVFRIGGDEFAVISEGKDYLRIDELIGEVNAHNEEAARTNGIVIACGMSKFQKDETVAAVFRRADANMYENKMRLKGEKDSSRSEDD